MRTNSFGPIPQFIQQFDNRQGGVVGQFRQINLCRVLCRRDARPATKHDDIKQRVCAQAVGAVHRNAGYLPCGVQPGNHIGVVAQHLSVDVGGHPAHGVVRGGVNRNRLRVGLNTQVGAGELSDVRQFCVDVRGLKVGEIQQHIILVRAAAAPLTHFVGHGSGDHVTRGQVLNGGRVALHKPFAVRVT